MWKLIKGNFTKVESGGWEGEQYHSTSLQEELSNIDPQQKNPQQERIIH